MLAGQSPKDDHSTVHVDTTPTCTRADAHVSRAHIAVHSSLINPMPWFVELGISVAHFSKILSCLRHVVCSPAGRPQLMACPFSSHLSRPSAFLYFLSQKWSKLLCLLSLEWNVWLVGKSDFTLTGNEPNFNSNMNEEHTPINLPDSHRSFPCRDDATIISTLCGARRFSAFRSIQQAANKPQQAGFPQC